MDARNRRYVVWSALIIAVAMIAVFRWDSFFSPRDYEECSENAARTAKSKDALSVLISTCNSKFSALRKPGGGYLYYDARQNREFEIAGPNPTEQEKRYIEREYSIYLEKEQQKR
jgi:hypothetical protein